MIDIGYGIRQLLLFLRHRAAQKTNLWVESVTRGRCWPNDLDTNLHMNNARYLREADFSRMSLFLDSGLWSARAHRRKTTDPQTNFSFSAVQVQYRQSVQLGDRFTFTSRIVGWDHRAFYAEQWMTMDKNQQVACSLICRVVVSPRSVSPQMLVEDLGYGSIESPVLPPDVQAFQQNHQLTSSTVKSKL